MILLDNDWEFLKKWEDDFLQGTAAGEPVRLPHTVEMLPKEMAGQKIEAAEALSWGLIDRIVAPEALPETVAALTADARGARPAHVGAIKAMIG